MDRAEPCLRAETLAYKPLGWATSTLMPLPIPAERHDDLALAVLGRRRTVRDFGPLGRDALGALLWHTCRCQQTLGSPWGVPLSLRPAPSAGAIHPIHILVEDPVSQAWCRYDPVEHALQTLVEQRPLSTLRPACLEVLDPGSGVLLAYAAEPGRTASKYANSEPLVWRDAGVLQGVMAIGAEALNLSFCLIGLTGDLAISQLAYEGQLKGVGLAVVGSHQ